ncbi:Retrovirus-related Pol polyprotein from transposon 297, partial [Stegodyphus mimosarum]
MKPIAIKNDKPPQLDLQHLPADEQEKLQCVISQFSNLFSDVPGFTQVVNHNIETGDAQPVRQKPYRYDKVKEEIIECHIKDMLKNKIITPISSSYASSVVLCKKNNDYPITHPKRWRFAIDYRKLNSVTKYPVYPLPIIGEIIRNISSTKYMTTLDLTSGYFQTGDPRQSILKEDVPQRKQQEPATMASKGQKKKAPPQQSRRNKNQKCGFKRKTDDAGASNKRPKQNGQGQQKVAKRTTETSERCLRSKRRRLQAEDQRPECSKNQEQRRTRAQERRAQSSKRPADHLPPQRKYPRIERGYYKRKRDE